MERTAPEKKSHIWKRLELWPRLSNTVISMHCRRNVPILAFWSHPITIHQTEHCHYSTGTNTGNQNMELMGLGSDVSLECMSVDKFVQVVQRKCQDVTNTARTCSNITNCPQTTKESNFLTSKTWSGQLNSLALWTQNYDNLWEESQQSCNRNVTNYQTNLELFSEHLVLPKNSHK